jgi:hypothetical protein
VTNERGSEGGKARRDKLTAEQRSEIARKGAMAKWEKADLPQALCGSPDKPAKVGQTPMRCYVLDDETRVITQGDFLEALGRHRKANVRKEEDGGEEQLPAILQGKALKPFITSELREKSRPIKFRTTDGSMANGYRAEILPMVCEMYLKARDAGTLDRQQVHVAEQAEILMRALAHVGIIALVDEATGFQEFRARAALAEIFEAFIAKELRKWVKRFPVEFFRQLCRLRGVAFREDLRFPPYFGHYINDLVYSRLAPGVLDSLKQVNPREEETGRRRHRHHQWLTDDVGDPRLREHLTLVIGLMRASDTYEGFYKLLERAAKKFREAPLFDQLDQQG